MNIDIETKTIGELALELPNAIAVMEKWQIDYCCHGHRTVSDACRSAGVVAEELLSAIGEPLDDAETDWQTRTLTELQNYILEKHHLYTRQAMETIDLLADKVSNRHGTNHPEVIEVRRLATELIAELVPHMLKEEQVLFSFIEALERAGVAPQSCFGSIENPIRVMMLEHERAGELLVELRAATNGYALPGDACLSFRALYERLADLEQDLHRHIHLENNVLFPRALAVSS